MQPDTSASDQTPGQNEPASSTTADAASPAAASALPGSIASGERSDAASLLPAGLRSGLLSMRTQLPAAAPEVWRWLVEPDLLAQWSPMVPDQPLTAVGEVTGHERPSGGAASAVDMSVTGLIEGFRLAHRWGSEEVVWMIGPDGNDTHLQLVHTLADASLSADAAATWHVALNRLRSALTGTPSAGAEAATLTDLRERYAETIVVNNADN